MVTSVLNVCSHIISFKQQKCIPGHFWCLKTLGRGHKAHACLSPSFLLRDTTSCAQLGGAPVALAALPRGRGLAVVQAPCFSSIPVLPCGAGFLILHPFVRVEGVAVYAIPPTSYASLLLPLGVVRVGGVLDCP